MNEKILLASAVFVPLIGSFATPIAGKISERLRNGLSLALVLLSLVCACRLIPTVISGRVVNLAFEMPLGLNFVITADCLAVFMAATSSFISAIIIIYSFDYIHRYDNRNEYYLMVTLFLGSMMGIVFSGSLLFLYIFWEITAIASWRLIGFFREKQFVIKADKAFLITVFGALAMLIGFIIIYQSAGSFELADIKKAYTTSHISSLALILIMLGILSKSATLPFHTWLPDAGVAPSPVTALLHAAVLVKIGIYAFARLFISTMSISYVWEMIVIGLVAASALISAGAALVETDMKRIIAYSTVSQIAFIFLGFAVNTEAGVAGGLLYILMHGLAKGGLFLCAGIVEQGTHTKDITKMGGLIATMPVTAVSFFACALSVMGVPPLGGFFSKYLVFSGTINAGHIGIAFVFLAGAILTILYLCRIFNSIFMGEAKVAPAQEGSWLMVSCVASIAFISFLAGIYIRYPALFASVATQQMLGR
ncbi:MAG: NADH-quinone oxidoreductase subunit L [Candidatus Omnitrophica bacterium]|nr:NADH-quinone oxidoreductase subunit L [Candidatus Omnitrophota bacterium]